MKLTRADRRTSNKVEDLVGALQELCTQNPHAAKAFELAERIVDGRSSKSPDDVADILAEHEGSPEWMVQLFAVLGKFDEDLFSDVEVLSSRVDAVVTLEGVDVDEMTEEVSRLISQLEDHVHNFDASKEFGIGVSRQNVAEWPAAIVRMLSFRLDGFERTWGRACYSDQGVLQSEIIAICEGTADWNR